MAQKKAARRARNFLIFLSLKEFVNEALEFHGKEKKKKKKVLWVACGVSKAISVSGLICTVDRDYGSIIHTVV